MSFISIKNILLHDAHRVQIKLSIKLVGLRTVLTGKMIFMMEKGSRRMSQKKRLMSINVIDSTPRTVDGRKLSIFSLKYLESGVWFFQAVSA